MPMGSDVEKVPTSGSLLAKDCDAPSDRRTAPDRRTHYTFGP